MALTGQTILTAAQTTGSTVDLKGGVYVLLVEDYTAALTVALRQSSTTDFIATDVGTNISADGWYQFRAPVNTQLRITAAGAGATVKIFDGERN